MKQQGYVRLSAAGVVRNASRFGFDLEVIENNRTTLLPCQYKHNFHVDNGTALSIEGSVVFNAEKAYVNIDDVIILADFQPSQGYQKTEVLGKMTSDIRPDETPNGIIVTNFSVSVYTGRDTYRVPCQAWRGAGKAVQEQLAEGHIVQLDGRTIFDGWKTYVDIKRFRALNALHN